MILCQQPSFIVISFLAVFFTTKVTTTEAFRRTDRNVQNPNSAETRARKEDIRKLIATTHTPGSSRSEVLQEDEDNNDNFKGNNTQTLRAAKSKRNSLPTPNDHLVTSLPYLSPKAFPTRHYAGHIPASNDGDKQFFYWLFEPSHDNNSNKVNADDVPLLIWLNGGPGCSSMDGLFIEIGPFRLVKGQKKHKSKNNNSHKDTWKIDINPHSWHLLPAYLLFIDQPVGTGLSFTKKKNYVTTDEAIATDFYHFLTNFLNIYKDFFLNEAGNKTKRPIYFSGESHAGHYIPSLMDHILHKNENADLQIHLDGAAIGNGWINPYYQNAGAEFAYGKGMIDLSQKRKLDVMEDECNRLLDEKKYDTWECYNLQAYIEKSSVGKGSRHKVSSYDVRKYEIKGEDREFPPGHKDVETYLGGWHESGYPESMTVHYHNVLTALHATQSIAAGQRFKECSDPVFNALEYQDGLGVQDEVSYILDHADRPRLLFFNGMEDLICNHVGNELVLENLEWRGKEKWSLANRYVWNVDDVDKSNPVKGYMKEYDNLLFLKILNAGHMVPMDKPALSLEMMRTFLYSGSFRTFKQELEGDLPRSKQNGNAVPCYDKECPVCPTEAEPFNSPTQTEEESLNQPSDQSQSHFDSKSNNLTTWEKPSAIVSLPEGGGDDKVSSNLNNEQKTEDDDKVFPTTTAEASDPLKQENATFLKSQREKHDLIFGLLLGIAFGCLASIIIGCVRRQFFGEDRKPGYAIGNMLDPDDDGFMDRRTGYRDNPES